MQNAQNTDMQRVINLVNTYRVKMREKYMTRELSKAEKEDFEKIGENEVTRVSIGIDINNIDIYCFNEQLLGHFYAVVAGSEAEEDVLKQLLPELYDTSIYTQEDEIFLKEHFRELVNYIIQTPFNEWYDEEHDDTTKAHYLIPEEILNLIESRVDIPQEAVIYNPFTGFGQFAIRYNKNEVYWSNDDDLYLSLEKSAFDFIDKHWTNSQGGQKKYYQRINSWRKSYAWARLAMYANNVKGHFVESKDESFNFDVLMAYVPYPNSSLGGNEMVTKVYEAYNNLPIDGTMVLLCPNSLMCSQSPLEFSFRKQLIEDNSIIEVIQLPQVMCQSSSLQTDYCLIVAKKIRTEHVTTFIAAGLAQKELDTRHYIYSFDMDAFNTILSNHGIDIHTGLRQVLEVSRNSLNEKVLLPQFYVIERPAEIEKPSPITDLCTLVTTTVREIQTNLPTDTPWIKEADLSYFYRGELNVATIEKADCSNNPPHTDEYVFNKSGEFEDNLWSQLYSPKGSRVYDYRNCTYLDGKKDVVLYKRTPKDGICIALLRATGQPVAVDKGISVFCPNDGFDALSLVALLKMPIVYRQIHAYGLSLFKGNKTGNIESLQYVLVPTDIRIIQDEVRRLKDGQKAYKAQQEKFESMKTEYINEVRMRKHDMGQYVFELINIEDLMRYYMENRDKEKDFCQQMENLLDNFKTSVGELSMLLDNLSKEEQFGEPELFNLNEFLFQLSNRHKTDRYKIHYRRDESSIKKYNRKLYRDDFMMDFMIDNEIDAYCDEQAIQAAMIDDEIDAYCDEQAIQAAMIDDEIDAYCDEQAIQAAMIDDEIDAYCDEQAIQAAMIDDEAYVLDNTQVVDDEAYVLDNTQVVDDEAYVFDNTQVVDEEAYVLDNTQVGDDETYVVDDTLAVDDEGYVMDNAQIPDDEPYIVNELGNRQLNTIPSLFVAPNDIHRLVNNILDNARKHGFTDSERNDYEVNVKLSIDTKRNMFQIDFRNNGNPLPDGMDKMRYGLLGEKAGKTSGTGIGGNYVKKFVEHYGGDYDVFMEEGWVVIRIYLPIK